jgi:hypothetical protein
MKYSKQYFIYICKNIKIKNYKFIEEIKRPSKV